MNRNKTAPVLGTIATIAVIALWALWASSATTALVGLAHKASPTLGPVLGIALIAGLVLTAVTKLGASKAPAEGTRDTGPYGYSRSNRRSMTAAVTAGFVAVALAGLAGFSFWWPNNYRTEAKRATVTKVNSDEAQNYKVRSPYLVERELLKRNAADLRGEIVDVTFVDDTWTAIVDGNGLWKPVKGVVAHTGEGTDPSSFTTCAPAGRIDGVNGGLGNALTRELRKVARNTMLDRVNMYGACIEDKAVLFWPATKWVGWAQPRQVPAGLFIIRSNSDIRFVPEAKSGEYPGPVYPITLAEEQMRATRALGDFDKYRRHETEYTPADQVNSADGDETDESPNEGNGSNLTLQREDGRVDYVTPVSVWGTSTNVVGVSRVAADEFRAGQLNTYEVRKLDKPRSSNKQVMQQVKTTFSELPWQIGMKVIELTPATDGGYVASLGLELDVQYRVAIDADSKACLTGVDGRSIRCAKLGTNGTSAPADQPAPAPVAVDSNMVELSDAELLELDRQLSAELARRLQAKSEQ